MELSGTLSRVRGGAMLYRVGGYGVGKHPSNGVGDHGADSGGTP